jgi:hypothetical protein
MLKTKEERERRWFWDVVGLGSDGGSSRNVSRFEVRLKRENPQAVI